MTFGDFGVSGLGERAARQRDVGSAGPATSTISAGPAVARLGAAYVALRQILGPVRSTRR